MNIFVANMACIADLPTELHLLVLPHLPLSSLIAARNTCQLWRSLVPVTALPLTRRKLLCLYDILVSIPAFQLSRRLARKHVRSGFGEAQRQAYIDLLPKDVGEEFKAWILEWPEDAIIASLWPALEHSYNMSEDIFTYRGDILNRMSTTAFVPTTHTLSLSIFSGGGSGPANVTALPLFEESSVWTHWVVLSGEQETLDKRGKKKRVDLRGIVVSKVRGADGEDGYAEFLESPSPLACPSSILPSLDVVSTDAGASTGQSGKVAIIAGASGDPETWGPWLRYLEQEVRKLQEKMEDSGAWCGCVACRR
jgi:hypothetical protein